MKIIKIDKKEWEQGIDKARDKYHLFGPQTDQGAYHIKSLEKNQLPDMDYLDTILSPKSILFPQTEKMMSVNLDESNDDHHILKEIKVDKTPRAVLGIKPYDAKAIELVKLNFDTKEYRDPYWCDAYEATTFIGLAVNTPGPCDFSTSAGSGPFAEDGLDMLLVDTGDAYLGKIITSKGEDFAKASGFANQADADAQETIERMKKDAEAAIVSSIDTSNLKDKTILDLYEAPFWDDLAFSCINCGTCTFVCPTCWCFDIQDETKRKKSIRFRNWDSCMSPLFTLHGSGHNPRGEKVQRVRQRFMHKLKYFFDKYDKGTMCVGCGRCVKQCPVNIDIREVCNTMNSYEKQK
jgi:sulfhydrogenase subunit beta (sulfur reductase)